MLCNIWQLHVSLVKLWQIEKAILRTLNVFFSSFCFSSASLSHFLFIPHLHQPQLWTALVFSLMFLMTADISTNSLGSGENIHSSVLHCFALNIMLVWRRCGGRWSYKMIHTFFFIMHCLAAIQKIEISCFLMHTYEIIQL